MEISVTPQGDVLMSKATGSVSVDEVLRVLKEIVDTACEQGFDKILLDLSTVTGELSTFELYEVGKTIAEYYVKKAFYVRVAVLGKPPTVTGFGAEVARNRGLPSETFSDSKAAMNWLGATGLTRVHRPPATGG